MKVYLAHTKREPDKRSRDFARVLADFLSARGISVTFDEFSFRPGHSLAEEMFEAIHSANKFILLATPNTLESEYVRAELQQARQRAIELNPKPFIHVISLARTRSLDYLPKDLRAFLCHIANGKSMNRLLYEVFFGLYALPLGKLLAAQLKYSRKSDVVMLERYQVLEVVSDNGDANFITERAIQNLDASAMTHTNQMNFWAYGKTSLSRPRIRAWLDTGEELKDKEITRRNLRGNDTFTVRFKFPKPVAPDEVVRFRTARFYPKAFDLDVGDNYTLGCDDRGYGLLRVDIVFPRGFKAKAPTVIKESNGKARPLGRMNELGSEKFAFSTLKAQPGDKFLFALKARS